MNPYSPELNFFLAYQYCRSLGLQLASFETKEKADSITQYLTNAGFSKFDFWVSGNKLGTDMYLWMSTGLPFNATFNYMKKNGNDILTSGNSAYDLPMGSTSPQRTARESGNAGLANSCVAMKAPTFEWDTDDCTTIKDFICEQTRCYYYNYGSIPVSTTQGKVSTTTTTTARPPFTSSSYSKAVGNNYVPFGLNELINKLKLNSNDNVNNNNANEAAKSEGVDSVDLKHVTNGPYDTFHSNVEMQDDPVATADHDDYVSTIEPEGVTWFARVP
ncbi:uncharacterized protein LOC108742682 [Agrilus planipennis]|uniref:Uncharacterized protein LOC108742682 n=1 Tax=Agrilus planipennis TaxID=224129 RepID=A0A1W4XLW5_AGRPL|nr:uncharacterized protein LOC108742682 [Agrilus planipennis]